jgi:hypothetical protein
VSCLGAVIGTAAHAALYVFADAELKSDDLAFTRNQRAARANAGQRRASARRCGGYGSVALRQARGWHRLVWLGSVGAKNTWKQALEKSFHKAR